MKDDQFSFLQMFGIPVNLKIPFMLFLLISISLLLWLLYFTLIKVARIKNPVAGTIQTNQTYCSVTLQIVRVVQVQLVIVVFIYAYTFVFLALGDMQAPEFDAINNVWNILIIVSNILFNSISIL